MPAGVAPITTTKGTSPPSNTLSGFRQVVASRQGETVDGGLMDIDGIGLVVVKEVHRVTERHYRYTCEAIRHVFGPEAVLPTTIDNIGPGACLMTIARGDTLAIPIKRTQASPTTLFATYCMKAFKVNYGYVPAFARDIQDLGAAFVSIDGRPTIRRIQKEN